MEENYPRSILNMGTLEYVHVETIYTQIEILKAKNNITPKILSLVDAQMLITEL